MGKNNLAAPAALRPRSLADALRNFTDEQLLELLMARPDLLHPAPVDMTELSTRATTGPSVSSALDQLNHTQLVVCESIAGLGDPCSIDELHSGLKNVPGYIPTEIDNAIAHLKRIALLWGTGNELHLVRVARESFGAYPCGLAGSFSSSRRQVREYETKKSLAKKVLSEGSLEVQEIMEQLLWSTPAGSMKNANRPVDITKTISPLEWLLARELIVPTSENSVVVPREVSLSLRNGRLMREIKTSIENPVLSNVEIKRIDDSGTHTALEFVRLVETLLESWSLEPPALLRGGGLSIRDFNSAVELLKTTEHTAALVIEVSHAAGLVNSDISKGWLPTSAYDRWSNTDDASRWGLLAQSWRDMTRAPHIVGGEGSERINPLTPAVDRSFIYPLRISILDIYLNMPIGSVTSPGMMTEYLEWHRPRRASRTRTRAIAKLLVEAELIGVTGMGALTSFGRALAQNQDYVKIMAANLPEPVNQIIVQADLTALAPGRLPAVARRAMAVLADVESIGVATTYRFTEISIRRALDQGQSASEILEFLAGISRTQLPQPLTYLIEDSARKHGILRVGVASIYLRCDDPQLVATVQADRRLSLLKFRELAPGIVVSSAPPETVLEELRNAGYAPVAESAEGTVLIHRPDSKRTSTKVETFQNSISKQSDRLVENVIKVLRSGEKSTKNKSNEENL